MALVSFIYLFLLTRLFQRSQKSAKVELSVWTSEKQYETQTVRVTQREHFINQA